MRKSLIFWSLVIASCTFNPQPDPPGKGTKHILGPNTKGSWKSYHDVEEKFNSKGGSKSFTKAKKAK